MAPLNNRNQLSPKWEVWELKALLDLYPSPANSIDFIKTKLQPFRTRGAIIQRAGQLGLSTLRDTTLKQRHMTDEEFAKALTLYLNGRTWQTVAAVMNISAARLRERLRKLYREELERINGRQNSGTRSLHQDDRRDETGSFGRSPDVDVSSRST